MRSIVLMMAFGAAALGLAAGIGVRPVGAAGGGGVALSPEEMALVRGASDPEGCDVTAEQKDCIGPFGTGFPSDCAYCTSSSGSANWNLNTGVGGLTPNYGNPAGCQKTEGTRYANVSYTLCKKPAVANSKVCNEKTFDCTWRVACNNGPLQQDKWCNLTNANFGCNVNKPPTDVAIGGGMARRTWYGCKECITGGDLPHGKTTAKKGTCVD